VLLAGAGAGRALAVMARVRVRLMFSVSVEMLLHTSSGFHRSRGANPPVLSTPPQLPPSGCELLPPSAQEYPSARP
jgi:hypothetical protein